MFIFTFFILVHQVKVITYFIRTPLSTPSSSLSYCATFIARCLPFLMYVKFVLVTSLALCCFCVYLWLSLHFTLPTTSALVDNFDGTYHVFMMRRNSISSWCHMTFNCPSGYESGMHPIGERVWASSTTPNNLPTVLTVR
ncbi:hypothetical protein BJ165DRAFT_41797 [Panaeolus papilionaceus]|nr:hypothetical protein BJ165DRAFT_41797 [Panaeolus papilionaceus]